MTNLKRMAATGLLPLLVQLSGPAPMAAQDVDPAAHGVHENGAGEDSETFSRALSFVRIEGGPPPLDGTLTHPAWNQAPVAGGFVQWRPDEGASPSQPTEARVLFADDALYVGIRAWDQAPDSIVGILSRRDVASPSDWVSVLIDSYHDRRTGFLFMVNPVGVKRDVLISEDYREDDGWQAIWDVAVNVDEHGWTAEFRIPYSQLRFGREGERSWGINFAREIARHQEISTWAPLSQQQRAMVSPSGVIEGIRGLTPPRRLEVQPYTVARMQKAPGDPANPFHENTALGAEIGGDVKLGIGNNLTLDLTMNPDFGQVEADPGQVNLSAFETFFPERRPFFLEGANIFRFGNEGAESLFHSRRIGRAPQGSVSGSGDWVDRPDQTRILAAGKVSGRTDGGWSLGLLSALTGEGRARIASSDGALHSEPVEPRTSHLVARIQRDRNEGRTTLGSVFTSTIRDGSTAADLELRDRAFSGGVDVGHRFLDDRFQLRGHLQASHVTGSREAILRTQRAPARYFQRPDADHLRLDEDRTSLTGHSGALDIIKVGGGAWRGRSLTEWRSPGFETNDLGFMNQGDHIKQSAYIGYERTRPGETFRRWNVYANVWSWWTFGGEHIVLGHNVNGSFELTNGWGGWGGVERNAPTLEPRLLRGGPAIRVEERFGGWFGLYSDSRRDLQLNWSNNWGVRPESDSWDLRTSPNLRWRPSPATQVQVGPFLSRNVDDRQWVTRIRENGETHYLFGRLDQTTVGMDLRADLALTPTLSVQLYAQPFMSSGGYDAFKAVADPGARRHGDRFRALDGVGVEPDGYGVDLTGDGEPTRFDNPDFGVRRFRSNLVLRWEYRPGSTVFLVWSQGRDHSTEDGAFHVGRGLSSLFGETPENTFMIKVNYWLNP